jgi:DNA-binding SARP family transcriptional activator
VGGEAGRVTGVAVRLLGPVLLTVDGAPAPLAGARQRALLAALATAPDTAVTADRLAEAVWSDTGRPAARSTLHVHVHQVRRALGPHAEALRYGPAGYRLAVATDLADVEAALRRARAADRAGDAVAAAAGYRAALDRWRGELCADLPAHEYFAANRAMYEAVRLDTLDAVLAVELRLATPDLVPELEALVERHPLRERFWGHLMAALYRDGRQADALAAFQRARRGLAVELGLDPGPALRELERAILGHADTSHVLQLAAPRPAGAGRPALTWLDGTGTIRRRELTEPGDLVIGRADDADVSLSWDPAASRRHAVVRVAAGGVVTVADLGSSNGTQVNGTTVEPPARLPLRPGDLVRCGDSVLALTAPSPARAAAGDPARADARTAPRAALDDPAGPSRQHRV